MQFLWKMIIKVPVHAFLFSSYSRFPSHSQMLYNLTLYEMWRNSWWAIMSSKSLGTLSSNRWTSWILKFFKFKVSPPYQRCRVLRNGQIFQATLFGGRGGLLGINYKISVKYVEWRVVDRPVRGRCVNYFCHCRPWRSFTSIATKDDLVQARSSRSHTQWKRYKRYTENANNFWW